MLEKIFSKNGFFCDFLRKMKNLKKSNSEHRKSNSEHRKSNSENKNNITA